MAVILNAGMSETKPHAQLTLQPLGHADQSPEDFLKDCIPSLSLSLSSSVIHLPIFLTKLAQAEGKIYHDKRI